MSLDYPNTTARPFIGTKSDAGVIAGATLTTAYTGINDIIETSGYSKINFDISYTMAGGESTNSLKCIIEDSPDRVNWYRIPNESASGAVSTLTAREFTFLGTDADTATISLGLDIFYKYLKVSFLESGASTLGTVYVETTLLGR